MKKIIHIGLQQLTQKVIEKKLNQIYIYIFFLILFFFIEKWPKNVTLFRCTNVFVLQYGQYAYILNFLLKKYLFWFWPLMHI